MARRDERQSSYARGARERREGGRARSRHDDDQDELDWSRPDSTSSHEGLRPQREDARGDWDDVVDDNPYRESGRRTERGDGSRAERSGRRHHHGQGGRGRDAATSGQSIRKTQVFHSRLGPLPLLLVVSGVALLVLVTFVIVIFVPRHNESTASQSQASSQPFTPRVLDHPSLFYLDAGHGKSGAMGYDDGAAGNGYVEAKETAELVTKVAQYAQELYGLNVYSNVDCDINYNERQAHAKSLGATALVSIHFNASGDDVEGEQGDGVETGANTPATAESVAGLTGTESYIYMPEDAGYIGRAAEGSEELQKIMHRALVGSLHLPDQGMKRMAYTVINGRETGVPAVLLEVCYLTDANDMATYKKREDSVARALAAGLEELYEAGF